MTSMALLIDYLAITTVEIVFNHLVFGDQYPAIRVLDLDFVVSANLGYIAALRFFGTVSLGIAVSL